MTTRDEAVAAALAFFDGGKFRERLARLVAIPSTSQEPGHEHDMRRYLDGALRPWLEAMGFTVALHANPVAEGGPILTAMRIEDPALRTVITYGHADTVRGLEEQWEKGLDPWVLSERGDRWYGRGTADNKGQHALNLTALEQVIAARQGRLGFNVKLVLECSEETGSRGLREFVSAHADELAADVLIASDGPRVTPDRPTIATGTRGSFRFDLAVRLRPGGVHSGNWGGIVADPAIILAHALTAVVERHGRIRVREWLPRQAIVPGEVRAVLAGCEPRSEPGAATIDPAWGEPGLTLAEKLYGWTSFIVLALEAGRPENPVNAVAPWARAVCQLRYTVDADPEAFLPGLRARLDDAGFPEVAIENVGGGMPASRTPPDGPWVERIKASMERTLSRRVQVIPNAAGGLPGDVFVDALGVPLVWIPHSYNGCKQHGPNEHLLKGPAREGLAAFAGIWWDLGEGEGTASADNFPG